MASRYRRLLDYVLRQRRWLLAIFLLTLASSAAAALQPWPMKLLVDYALGDRPAPERLNELLATLGLSAAPRTLVILAAISSLALFALTSALSVALSLCWVSADSEWFTSWQATCSLDCNVCRCCSTVAAASAIH